MACYDQIKLMIVQSGVIPNGLPTQFCAAFGAGFFMATTVAPSDMVRTKLMNQPPDAKIYNGFVDCVIKVRRILTTIYMKNKRYQVFGNLCKAPSIHATNNAFS